MNGTVIAAPQTFNYFERIQERIVSFVAKNSNISPLVPADGGAEIHDPLAGLGGVLFLVFTAGRGFCSDMNHILHKTLENSRTICEQSGKFL